MGLRQQGVARNTSDQEGRVWLNGSQAIQSFRRAVANKGPLLLNVLIGWGVDGLEKYDPFCPIGQIRSLSNLVSMIDLHPFLKTKKFHKLSDLFLDGFDC